MKSIINALYGLATVLVVTTASASGDLTTNAQITRITIRNFDGITENFIVTVSGGTGPCGNANITFPLTGNADRDSRMLSLATAAYLSGKRIRAHDYGTTISCDSADYLHIAD